MNSIRKKLLTFSALLILLALFFNAGCGDDPSASSGQANDDDNSSVSDDDDNNTDDDDDDDDSDDLPNWIKTRPYLQNLSLWRQDIDMATPDWPRNLGIIGIGNGKVYGNVGDRYPLSSWHNLGGPNYQKYLKWFTDKVPRLLANGQIQNPDHQSMARVRNSSVVLITSKNESMEWTGVNFAPIYADDSRVEDALVTAWIIRNVGQEAVFNVTMKISSTFGWFDQGSIHESDWNGRKLTMHPLNREAVAGERAGDMVVPLGDFFPGDEKVFYLPMVFSFEEDDPEEIFNAIKTAGVGALLESTVDWWNTWASQITQIVTPDEKFNDLLRGLAVSIKINQAISGGVSEMNQYSNTWLRDIHGPSIYYPLIGLQNDYEQMSEYLWGAILTRGGIANAFNLDYDLSDLPSQPDWDSMGVMSGRTRAEGPSLLVLEYENYYKATGDISIIEQRWGMLKHAVLKQQYVDGCLLHFSSDETFEDLMEAIFGENFLEEPDESTLSFYSSILAKRAAGFLAQMAAELGYSADETIFSDLADAVETCMEDNFWMDSEGRYAVKVQTDTRVPHVQPYEDINTMPIWLNALPLDNPRVVSNFEQTLTLLGHEDGLLYSDIPFPFSAILPHVEKGVLTGMSHGYWLNNLDKMFHPMADVAFDRWRDVFSTTGFTDEAVVVDDFGHLSILKEPFGAVGNVSSRFRSWESGIMGFAFLYHITGFDYSVPGSWVKLAPHLPSDWEEMAFNGLPFGENYFDLEVAKNGDKGREITISTDANASFDLMLTVPLDGDVSEIKINGATLAPSEYDEVINSYGRTVVYFEPVEIGQDSMVEISIAAQ